MKQFLATVLLMGIVHLPSIEKYWKTKICNRFTRSEFLNYHENSKITGPHSAIGSESRL